jgi:hypothetical protein
MAPPSQLGAALFGGVLGEKIEYSVGVYNGGPGMTQADRGEGLLYAARLQVSPLGPVGPAESDCDGSDFRVSLGGGGYYSDDSSVETVAVGTDLRVQWHGLSLAGELLWDRHQPVDDPELPPNPLATIERRGWYAQAGYFLLPARLELSGRYEWYDDQRNEDNAGDLWLATGGMSLWLADGTLKLQLNYIHREERAFVELDNDIVLGQVQVDL